MTKYYRARTQEQWDWLMHWFEEQDRKIRWIAGEKPTEDAVHLNYARIWVIQLDDNNRLSVGSNYQFTECDHITDFIETSKMMERYSLDKGYVRESRGKRMRVYVLVVYKRVEY